MNKLSYLMVLCWSCTYLIAQNVPLRFDNYGSKEGISQNYVTAIGQDQQGFLWFGTNDGLNRFDGYTFKVYQNNASNPNSLSNNLIYKLLLSTDNTLWIGTGNGLNRYRPDTDDFIRYQSDTNRSGAAPPGELREIFEDAQGRLWLATNLGEIGIFDPDLETYESLKVRIRPQLPAAPLRAIMFARDHFWIASNGGGLFKIDPHTFDLETYRPDPLDPRSIPSSRIFSMLELQSGELLFATGDGLAIMNREYEGFVKVELDVFDIEDQRIFDIHQGKDGVIWAGARRGGLIRYNPETGEQSRFANNPDDSASLPSNFIYQIFEDSTGLFWIGSRGGVSKLDQNKGRFKTLNSKVNPDICEQNVWGVYQDEGIVYIVSSEGITQYNEADSNVRCIKIEGLQAHSIRRDDQGRFWVGSNNQGIFIFDDVTAEPIWRSQPDSPEFRQWIMTMLIESDEAWLGTFRGGLYRITLNEEGLPETVTNYRPDRQDLSSLSGASVFSLLRTTSGELWIGTRQNGLNRFDPLAETFELYTTEVDNPFSLSDNQILDLHEDQEETLWIGTSKGLNMLPRGERDAQYPRFKSYRIADGLPNDFIYAIEEDLDGYLWLSTTRGLSRFDANTETFTNFDTRDGLHGEEFNYGADFLDQNGRLYFGGVDGLTYFQPRDLKADPTPPRVVFTDFRILNRSAKLQKDDPLSPLQKQISQARELKIPHTIPSFSVQFAGLHFAGPERNTYRYTMDGFDNTWIETDATNRIAAFTNLDPGNYTLRVKASNKDGVWSEEDATIKIQILPAPWETWWAKTLYVLVVVVIIGLFLRLQVKKLEQEKRVNQRLRQLDTMKDQFLASTSHELRTPLNGIIGLAEGLLAGTSGELDNDQQRDLSLIVKSGHRLTDLVNDILDFAKIRDQGIQLDLRALDLRAVVDVVLTMCAPLISGRRIELANEVPASFPAVKADENRLQQILYNLIGNAVKFTEQGHVAVSAEIRQGNAYIRVEDTGVGIRKEDLTRIFNLFEQADGGDNRRFGGSGMGLAIVRQLVHMHGGVIDVQSSVGKGSVFGFTLSLSQDTKEDTSPSKVTYTFPDSIRPTAEKEEDAPVQDLQPQTYQVLIVDDEPVNCRVVENFLKLEGYNTLIAEGGQKALDLFSAETPPKVDLVILDVMMPQVSGYRVCRQLRETYSTQELPVIFLTAKDQTTDIVSGFAVGANDFVTKPVARDELLARVGVHIRLLDAHRTLEEKVDARTEELRQRNEEIIKTQEQLVIQEKLAALGVLTAGVAHEINNPTNFAHVSAQNLEVDLRKFHKFLRELAGDDAGDELLDTFDKKFSALFEHLNTVMEGSSRIQQIVRDLHVFSRLDESETKSIRIGDTLESTINLVRTKYRETAEFIHDFHDNPEVRCRPAQLNQVFMNLVVNACQAIQKRCDDGDPVDGRVEISLAQQDGSAVIRFKDNGCGIPKDVRDKIFEPFFTTKEVGEGTGLGLSITFRIIEQHNGAITVDSQMGEGATFTLRLPLNAVDSSE